MQVYIEEIGRKSVDWNQPVEGWDQWCVILNAALNHYVPEQEGSGTFCRLCNF
jgi:hypothetical protein